MSGASSTGGRESDARAPTPRMTGVPTSADPAALNSYLLGVAAAAALPSSYNHNAQLLQLAALQHWQAQSQLLPALSANLTPQALTALYYNQFLSSFPAQSASPDQHPVVARQPSLPSVPARPSPIQPAHPALTRIASEGPRRKSLPVLPAVAESVHEWSPSNPDEAGPSSVKPVLSSPKAIQEHIDQLISANEAIVLPQAPLLQKRRTYQRHNIADPKPYQGLSSPPKKQSAGRSSSLVESQLSPNIALHASRQAHLAGYHRGSLPANVPMFPETSQPAISNSLVLCGPQIPTTHFPNSSGFKCQHCDLDFPSDKALQAHVFRCSRNIALNPSRNEMPPLVSTATPRQPLAAALSLDPNLLLQLQMQQQQSFLKAQAEQLIAQASAVPLHAPSPTPPAPPKSQHPLKKRILAEHMLEASINAQPSPKLPKLETAEKAVGGPVDVHRPVPTKPLAVPVLAPPAHAIALTVTLSTEEKSQKFTPYTRTIEVEGSEPMETPRSGRRPRHVTAPTFVCMKRPQPFFLPHTDPKRSMYSSWQQVHVNPVEAKLNLLWMGGCCTRPRKGSHPYWKYTVANSELGIPRMTHSTFAQYSKKLRATQDAEASKKEEVEKEPVAEEEATKKVLWERALKESALRRQRRLSTKRHFSVDSCKSEESEVSGRLQIGSPLTSDTDDACEIEYEGRNVEGPGKLTADKKPLRRTRYVGGTSESKTPPMLGSDAVVAASLARDCQSVPAIGVSWPSPPPPVTTASPLNSPTALLSPTRSTRPFPISTNLAPFLVSAASLECSICDKRFAKPDQLRLHMDIHVYQEGARKKAYACSACTQTHFTKAALHKHLQSAHPGEPIPVDPPTKDPDTDTRGNPRPFKCTDCDTAFRGQGFLQKHLRSKLHVMKLECTGKLPFGTYALFEAANFNLAEIDTTDCESALVSMRKHAAALQPGFPIPTEEEDEGEAKPSLVCSEDAVPPSPPPQSVSPIPAKEDPETPTKTSIQDNKCVVAKRWIPPKEDEIVKVTPQSLPRTIEKAKHTSNGDESASEESQHSIRDSEPMTNGLDSSAPKTSHTEEETSDGAPQTHICHFCKLQTVSGTDLEVHLHADHIAMKDGNDFRCPRPNCDKIYPSRESLRHHIAAHYLGGVAASHGLRESSERDGDVSRETMAALQRKLGAGGAPGPSSTVPPAETVGNQSPGTPEQSQTSFAAVSGGRKKMKTHLVALNSIPEAAAASSPHSEAASEASSPSPIPQAKPVKRKSLEEQFHSPLNKRDALSGRRCASALENNPSQPSSSAFTSLGSPSYSLPAVPAHIGHHAPLTWFGNGLLNTPFALLHQAQNMASQSLASSPAKTEASIACPICQATLNDVGGLQRHLMSHVGNRPHICPECDAGFTTQTALQQHAISHRGSAAEWST